MARILVTGAAGFIGFHCCKRLLARGDQVVGLDNLNPYYEVRLKEDRLERLQSRGDFDFHKLSLEDRAAIESFFGNDEFAAVLHLGAQPGVRYSLKHPHSYADSNLTGFLNVIEGCRQRRVRHLVYASSSSVYGANSRPPFSVRDNVDHPVSLYAATKKANELIAHSYSHLYGIPTTGLRFFTVYGPWGRPDMAYFSFTKAILEGEPIRIFNYGRMKRDFTYVDDIADAVVKVLDIPPSSSRQQPDSFDNTAPYRIYNIGNNRSVELMDFIGTLEAALGKRAQKEFLPLQPGDLLETCADINDLSRDFGFRPRTDLKEGIGRFVEWYRRYYGV